MSNNSNSIFQQLSNAQTINSEILERGFPSPVISPEIDTEHLAQNLIDQDLLERVFPSPVISPEIDTEQLVQNCIDHDLLERTFRPPLVVCSDNSEYCFEEENLFSSSKDDSSYCSSNCEKDISFSSSFYDSSSSCSFSSRSADSEVEDTIPFEKREECSSTISSESFPCLPCFESSKSETETENDIEKDEEFYFSESKEESISENFTSEEVFEDENQLQEYNSFEEYVFVPSFDIQSSYISVPENEEDEDIPYEKREEGAPEKTIFSISFTDLSGNGESWSLTSMISSSSRNLIVT